MHQQEATKDFSPTIPWEEGSLRRLIEIIRLRNLFRFCDVLIPDISGWINSIFFLINFKVREGPFHKPSPKWLFLLRFRKSDILHRCLPDPWYWYGRGWINSSFSSFSHCKSPIFLYDRDRLTVRRHTVMLQIKNPVLPGFNADTSRWRISFHIKQCRRGQCGWKKIPMY